ncbi:Monacolin J acid methylbutanoyltransferase [Paramyrothecium foliicola]|nr:Monacolin J acid methylbutanoyltransferase [Paramyrothecium foliicola]
MDILDEVLRAYTVGEGQTNVTDVLLGVSFMVVNATGIVYSGSSGRQGFDVDSPLYTVDTMPWLASMTKLLTITCVLQLVERGLISLFEDLRIRVPELGGLQILNGFDEDGAPQLENNTRPVTLRHLLTHTSGFAYDITDPDLIRFQEVTNRTVHAQTWSIEGFTSPLKFEPGSGWIYGIGIDWAGYVLETVTNRTIADYMQEHILDPLEMDSTTFDPDNFEGYAARDPEIATGSETNIYDLVPGVSIVPESHPMDSGGAGLFGSTADYAKLLSATLRGDLLEPYTQELLFRPQLTPVENEAFIDALSHREWEAWVPEMYPYGIPMGQSMAGVVNLEDSPGRRREGSLMWSGATNGRWWIDRATGIAAVMTTELQPHPHPGALELFRHLEALVYRHLV